MCLAVPMRIVSIEGHMAWCEAKGVRRRVSLTLLGEEAASVGDHVLVHVDYALQVISAEQAGASWDPLDQVGHELDRAGA